MLTGSHLRLTILFDSQFYVGLIELEDGERLYTARYVFGAEPSDQEVLAFVQRDFLSLRATMQFGVEIEKVASQCINFKRMQREVRRTVNQQQIGAKSQEAMRLAIEAGKQERHVETRRERENLHIHKREIARQKAKARHREH